MKQFFLLLFLLSLAEPARSQLAHSSVYVDSSGVMRWRESQREVSLFGVNYTLPFAYAYRAHARLGLSKKKAIDLDVAHMKRLGLDAFRVHVWEKEITDSLGNLRSNDHLDLLDYLVARLDDAGIKTILTPIAWWGTGWPEPDPPVQGFTRGHEKIDLITDPTVRAAERRYLRQFITHVNPYTKRAYKNDPNMIAVEIVNEPRHPDSTAQVTDYINEMAGVLRDAGLAAPIFYNISETWSMRQANAVADAAIDGVSFQWYPTGLVHGSMLQGDYLANVNRYRIPSDSVRGYATKAKMVYEFDAADCGGSFMYPAMARCFREAGMQFAAMFSYDPVQIAWSNTEYPTHFLNLLYAPSKAISLMIAGKAFRVLPCGQSYGDYPVNNRFGDFRVSAHEELSEMNGETEYDHSTSTQTQPRNAAALEHIAGCGSSPLVRYEGTGAYFLDKLGDGLWRLEVYPDALWIRDPFEPTSMTRQVSRLFWNVRPMRIALPDLGSEYTLHSLSTQSEIGGDSVRPGIYLVARKGTDGRKLRRLLSKKEPFLDGLALPPASASGLYVVNRSARMAPEGRPGAFVFEIAGDKAITRAALSIKRAGWRGFATYPLTPAGGFRYVVADTPRVLGAGRIEYCVTVEQDGRRWTFPGETEADPAAWDFLPSSLWQMNLAGGSEDVVIVDASDDRRDIVLPHFTRTMRYTVGLTNAVSTNEAALAIAVAWSGTDASPFACQVNVSRTVREASALIARCTQLVVRARSADGASRLLALDIMTADGENYGTDLTITPSWQDISVPVSSLKKRARRILPDAYPLFLERTRTGTARSSGPLDPAACASVQFGIHPSSAGREAHVELASLRMAK